MFSVNRSVAKRHVSKDRLAGSIPLTRVMKYIMKRNFEYKIGCGCISAIMAIWLIIGTLLIFWTDRNLDFWVSYIRGEEVDVPIGLSILAVLFGPFGIAFNVISEIARLCV